MGCLLPSGTSTTFRESPGKSDATAARVLFWEIYSRRVVDDCGPGKDGQLAEIIAFES